MHPKINPSNGSYFVKFAYKPWRGEGPDWDSCPDSFEAQSPGHAAERFVEINRPNDDDKWSVWVRDCNGFDFLFDVDVKVVYSFIAKVSRW